MCKCNPMIRTPWCGKGDCKPPGLAVDVPSDVLVVLRRIGDEPELEFIVPYGRLVGVESIRYGGRWFVRTENSSRRRLEGRANPHNVRYTTTFAETLFLDMDAAGLVPVGGVS